MKIQLQHIYHGPALMQIVEHSSFKALNKADATYGHYLVNNDKRLWLKYSTSKKGPWLFTFSPADLGALRGDLLMKNVDTFIVLACGHHTIACLDQPTFSALIDVNATASQPWIKVTARTGKQLRVNGSTSPTTPTLIAHNAFPNCIF